MANTYLDPRVDIVFKKLFGNQAKAELAISLLNSVLDFTGDQEIQAVTFADPHNVPHTDWLKASIVNVRCTDKRGRHFIIELQVAPETDYFERCQYYTALALSRQLNKSANYWELEPVIFVAFLDFRFFSDERYLRSHHIMDKETHEIALTYSRFVFVELPKFLKTIDEVETIADKWLYFLKHASELDAIPKKMQTPTEMHAAFDTVNQTALSRKELTAYDAKVMRDRHARSLLATAESIGEGRAKRELAQKLLQHMPVEQVAEITGLTVKELKKLS